MKLPPKVLRLTIVLSLAHATGCAPRAAPTSSPTRVMPPGSTLAKAPTTQPAPLGLTVLGSGGPGATGRASSCFVLSLDRTPKVLVDAGPGAFARLGEVGLSLKDLDVVLLTHLHVDHSAELPGILKARAVSVRGPIDVRVFGPTGAGQFPSTSRFVDLLFGKQGAFAYLAEFSAPLTVTATDVDATPRQGDEPRKLLEQDGLRIDAIPGHHDDAPAVIYRVAYKGRSVVFSGDIDPAGLDNLRLIADRCDLLVFNAVVLDPPGSPPILYTLHTPPQKIGEVAGPARAGALLLAHLNPSIDESHEAVRASIRRHYAGPVTFAEDRMHIMP